MMITEKQLEDLKDWAMEKSGESKGIQMSLPNYEYSKNAFEDGRRSAFAEMVEKIKEYEKQNSSKDP